jgi:hypothetical protein
VSDLAYNGHVLSGLGLAILILAPPDERALTVFRQMSETLASAKAAELEIEGELSLDNKFYPWRSLVKVSRDPIRYWARVQGDGPVGLQYVLWNGKLTYTDDEGKRKQDERASRLSLVNWASSPAYYGWETLFEAERFKAATAENTIYVQEEEIEGRVCDMVGLIKRVEAPEKAANIRYYWIDRETHLPKAFQVHALIRGNSTLTRRMKFLRIELDPNWGEDPFQTIPERVPAAPRVETDQVAPGKPLTAGSACPSVEVQTADMKRQPLGALLGKSTLITFWAPW